MSISCPSRNIWCVRRGRILRYGRYYRKSDKKWISRFKCTRCLRHFSKATNSSCFGQNKRQLNHKIYRLLVSGVSQRRIAMMLSTKRSTVARKLSFLGLRARYFNLKLRSSRSPVEEMQFDDLETFEHTKLKPLSVTLAVEKGSRFILGAEVARMPAKGLLAKKSIKKYGFRQDERTLARNRLFRKIESQVYSHAILQSDENPHYPASVKEHFPDCRHLTCKGQRGAVTGQGELKKIGFDPLFSLNHICAMLRANINRLFRKTWCTTKRIQPLIDHLDLYIMFHNSQLL